ncbi:MAG: DUF2867 domain-containing protein [Elusimicrobia bacterium CG08_land_8_20_14_0_20_51_18]|nr:MAG: DUF2867 domain-containing protein [Elusimicrobia bacterium CG08_land_8_20_14_0_20_51_18]
MSKKILLTGPTGYVGLRLAPRLIEKGYEVRCCSRTAQNLKSFPWAGSASLVKGDFYCGSRLDEAFEGIDTAYYLMHSMNETSDFEKHEEIAALNFAEYAKKHGVKKVVYLGGLGRDTDDLSKHLRSRHKVGEILRSSGLNVTEFRAGIIVGSGSVSFEMIRYLSERLPLIPNFRYIGDSKCQPIAIRDVLSYLIGVVEKPETDGKIIEIAGPSVLKYIELVDIYSSIRGLKRPHFSCLLWSAGAYSRFISLITPIPYNIARSLIESLRNDAVKSNDDALRLFPEIKPLDYATAVKYALVRISENRVESSWTTSYMPHYLKPCSFVDVEGLILQDYNTEIASAPETVYKIFTGIGGERGYYFAQGLWDLKAWQDKLVGGIGMRTGRRDPDIIHQGETLDFWRVERIIENRMMLLRAEMKLPGRGWLQFQIAPAGENDKKTSLFRVTAYFEPRGFFGYFYWYALYPVHTFIFKGLIKRIKRMAEARASSVPDVKK